MPEKRKKMPENAMNVAPTTAASLGRAWIASVERLTPAGRVTASGR